ncbi:Hypothetical predicted protein [Marmota monax]|uniref:C-type lectin domain-containing protein n=1 Tax=Marmota monax TaxID=9995 RepID=A0A5E4CI36_MARMO|nr:Hypothetical predicted protein [Marmota monax]
MAVHTVGTQASLSDSGALLVPGWRRWHQDSWGLLGGRDIWEWGGDSHPGAGSYRLCRPCPWDWTFFRGHCYFFSKSQRNWNDSVTACQEMRAQLVVIKSAEEQNFLLQTFKNKGSTWMGLSDLNEEATWHWVDGSPLSPSLTYWNEGEPNNVGEEDCAEITDSGWNDAKCDAEKFWVCKTSSSSCPNT